MIGISYAFYNYEMRRRRGEITSGFTLIELMIVVVIIGLLAALAIPRFMKASKKSKISEARIVLKRIWTCDQVYYEEYGVFYGAATDFGSTGLSAIGFDKVSGAPRFAYSIVVDTDPYYVAEAYLPEEGGDGSLEGYELQMDREGNFVIFQPGEAEVESKPRRGNRYGHYK